MDARFTRGKSAILERSLTRPKTDISLSAFSLLFSEIVQYCQNRVYSVSELQNKLSELGQQVGARILDVLVMREKNELVTSYQSNENASGLEYESVPFSGLRTRKLMQEGVKMEPASVMFLDEQERRAFGKKHFIIFCVVLFCCLAMVIVALVMASLRCFYKCPSGWLEAKKSCYRSFMEPNKWNEGRHMCQSLGADLIVIEEEKEQEFLNYKMHSKQNSFWIGLYNVGGKPWKWVDGTNVSYQKLKRDELTEVRGSHCATSSRNELTGDEWNSIDCTKMHPYICEKDMHISCVVKFPLSHY